MLDDGNETPRCVLCNAVLSNKAMKPSKLKRHLQQKHPEHEDKDLWFFQTQKLSLKWLKLDARGYFQQQSTASVEAFFEVAPRIVEQKIAPYHRRNDCVHRRSNRNMYPVLMSN